MKMELNVLPKSKFLSLSPRNTHRSSQNTTQTVNVILPNHDTKDEASVSISTSRCSASPNKLPEQVDLSVAPSSVEQPIYSTDKVEHECQSAPALQSSAASRYVQPIYSTREVKLDGPADKLSTEDSISTINFLKLVLESYMNNPIKYNDFIICSVPVLEHLIETLTDCDDCSIDIADFETGCCGTVSKRIVPVQKIWCRNGDVNDVFKYKYSQYLQIFEEYKISLKFVYVE